MRSSSSLFFRTSTIFWSIIEAWTHPLLRYTYLRFVIFSFHFAFQELSLLAFRLLSALSKIFGAISWSLISEALILFTEVVFNKQVSNAYRKNCIILYQSNHRSLALDQIRNFIYIKTHSTDKIQLKNAHSVMHINRWWITAFTILIKYY